MVRSYTVDGSMDMDLETAGHKCQCTWVTPTCSILASLLFVLTSFHWQAYSKVDDLDVVTPLHTHVISILVVVIEDNPPRHAAPGDIPFC